MREFLKAAISGKGYSPCEGYSFWKMGNLGQKLKTAKNMQKTILQEHLSCFVQKTAGINTKYSRNEKILKIAHLRQRPSPWKAYGVFKLVSLGQKLKMPKTCKKRLKH